MLLVRAMICIQARRLKQVMNVFAILCCIVCAPSTLAQTDAEYEAQLKKLEQTIHLLQEQLKQVKGSRAILQKDLQHSEEEISELMLKIDNIQKTLKQEKIQLNQHQQQRNDLEDARQEQQKEIKRIVKSAYVLGRESHIKLLLNQEEPDLISRISEYHNYVVAAHQQKIARFRQTIAEIEAIEMSIQISSEKLAQSQQALVEQFNHLKSRQTERLATIAKVNQQLQQQGGRLSKLRDDRKRLERLLNEATQALSELVLPVDSVPFASVKGKLPFPVEGRILHQFGASKVAGKMRWNGLLLWVWLGARLKLYIMVG